MIGRGEGVFSSSFNHQVEGNRGTSLSVGVVVVSEEATFCKYLTDLSFLCEVFELL